MQDSVGYLLAKWEEYVEIKTATKWETLEEGKNLASKEENLFDLAGFWLVATNLVECGNFVGTFWKSKCPWSVSKGIFRGTKRNRTAVAGFADLCLTTRP